VCEGKASFVDLTTRLQEDDGLPVTGLKADVVYVARRAVEAQHNLVFTEKFACLPWFLHDIVAKNPGSWMDVKRNEHTSEFMAAFFAFGGECVLKAGLQPLYPLGHTNFTDRHKGAHCFGSAIPGIISITCTKHIIENARDYVQTAQKSFHDNMVWELQGSKSAGEYYVHLAKFNTNFPDVKVNVWFIVPRVLHIIVH
jgi:hypothetical protein